MTGVDTDAQWQYYWAVIAVGTDRRLGRDSGPEGRSTMTKIQVQCQECGRKFSTASMLPSCPKCGGSDIDLR
ncbi:MAG: hypothetical protein ACE5I7_19295 [Candidatus Binatia bacterium]